MYLQLTTQELMENGLIGVNAVHLVMMKATLIVTSQKLNPNVDALENAQVDNISLVTILEIALKWLIVMIANTADSMADQLSMIAETTNAIFKRGHPYFVRLFIFCPFCHFFNFCPFDPFVHFLSSLSICSIFFNIVQKYMIKFGISKKKSAFKKNKQVYDQNDLLSLG